MPSAQRDNRTIHTVPCPRCHARVGSQCFVHGANSGNPSGRPQVHQERRKAYQQWRAEHPAFGGPDAT